MKKSNSTVTLVILLLVACQGGFWLKTRDIRPDLSIVPSVPSKTAIKALTLGDDQFYFRALGLYMQNFGDTFGRFSPLKLYDFHKLTGWFRLLDSLDSKSNLIPSMAAYYFSQTQNTPDVKYVVDYLYEHSMQDVKHNWWWLIQCIYLAMHKLNDMDLALKVAKPLTTDREVPAWAQQMLAVVYEKRGEMGDAYKIITSVKDNSDQFTDSDLKYMRYFIEERLHRMEEIEKTNK